MDRFTSSWTWGRLSTPRTHPFQTWQPARAFPGLPHESGRQSHSRGPGSSFPGGTLSISLLVPQGAGGARGSCKPPSSWWFLVFPLTISSLPPQPEHESTTHGTKVPQRRAPRTGVMRKGRKCTSREEVARNISRSTPESTLPPEDAHQLAGAKEKQGRFRARRSSSGASLSLNASSSLLPATDADQPAKSQRLPR